MTSETASGRANRLLRLGLDLAVRLHDETPDDVAPTLARLDLSEMWDLVILLARCVDVEKPYAELVWWASGDERTISPAASKPLQPCGTASAYRRHKTRGEQPCIACVRAYRQAERIRYQERTTQRLPKRAAS